jgi:hypothetical protein
MNTFKQLEENSDIQALIKSTFDADLPLSGGWGYTEEQATIIHALPEGMTLPQLEQMVTTIRAHLEMNITQEEAHRYGAINANETAREAQGTDLTIFDEVSYDITGIKEAPFKAFIKEYKEGYGKEDFDLNAHFERRKEATLTREVTHYFEVTALQ